MPAEPDLVPGDTAVAIAADVRAGRRTARQVVEAALARAGDAERLGGFEDVRAVAALLEADAVDRRPDRAELPLAGVPVAIKDNVAVAGEPMRNGSAATDPARQPADHEVVRRLRAAGAVVIGRTRVPELCVFATTDGGSGRARNPWRADRTPGGSSGGSAVAVAAGVVPVAHGNDGMGSLRIPAACCGLIGVKPGTGVVPRDLGGGWFGLAENGVLATTVADAALALAVLADRPGLASAPRSLETGRLRIAVSTRSPLPHTKAARAWREVAVDAGTLLREAGHTVVAADPPYGPVLPTSLLIRWAAGTEQDARRATDRSALAPRTARHAALGRAALRTGFPHERGRRRWRHRAERFFADLDVLVTPTLAQDPPPAGAWSRRGWLANVWSDTRYAPFAAPWNLAGWPALSLPAGRNATGVPRAVQLVATPGSEALLLALAAQLEQARPWARVAPGHPLGVPPGRTPAD